MGDIILFAKRLFSYDNLTNKNTDWTESKRSYTRLTILFWIPFSIRLWAGKPLSTSRLFWLRSVTGVKYSTIPARSNRPENESPKSVVAHNYCAGASFVWVQCCTSASDCGHLKGLVVSAGWVGSPDRVKCGINNRI